MKNIIKFIGTNKWIILLILVLSLSFYWYEWRPSQIEKECSDTILKAVKESGSSNDIEAFYGLCVKSGGPDNMREAVR